MQHVGPLYHYSRCQIVEYLTAIRGIKTLDTLTNNKRVMFINLAPLSREGVENVIDSLQFGHVYFIPPNTKRIDLIKTGNDRFTTTVPIKVVKCPSKS